MKPHEAPIHLPEGEQISIADEEALFKQQVAAFSEQFSELDAAAHDTSDSRVRAIGGVQLRNTENGPFTDVKTIHSDTETTSHDADESGIRRLSHNAGVKIAGNVVSASASSREEGERVSAAASITHRNIDHDGRVVVNRHEFKDKAKAHEIITRWNKRKTAEAAAKPVEEDTEKETDK